MSAARYCACCAYTLALSALGLILLTAADDTGDLVLRTAEQEIHELRADGDDASPTSSAGSSSTACADTIFSNTGVWANAVYALTGQKPVMGFLSNAGHRVGLPNLPWTMEGPPAGMPSSTVTRPLRALTIRSTRRRRSTARTASSRFGTLTLPWGPEGHLLRAVSC